MAKAGLLDIAAEVILSCEVGYAKPHARIYTLALQRVGADPRDALFIDDTPGHVAAAEALGMTGHVHTSTTQTIARVGRFIRPRA
jgi:putative hydrolase of the HAD superfamily